MNRWKEKSGQFNRSMSIADSTSGSMIERIQERIDTNRRERKWHEIEFQNLAYKTGKASYRNIKIISYKFFNIFNK